MSTSGELLCQSDVLRLELVSSSHALLGVVVEAAGWDALAERPTLRLALSVCALSAAAIAALAAWRERHVAPRGAVATLVLRLLAIAFVLQLVIDWRQRPTVERVTPSRVVLLEDTSASMGLAAMNRVGAPTRESVARAAADALAERLGERHAVERRTFATAVSRRRGDIEIEADIASAAASNDSDEPTDEAAETSVAQAGVAEGTSTRLGSAVERALAAAGETPPAAIVVVTDGGWNAGPDPRDAAATAVDLGVPVYTLGMGPRDRPPSVTLARLTVPERVAANDPFEASATIDLRGLPDGTTLSVVVTREGADTPLNRIERRLSGRDGRTTEKIGLDPLEPGAYVLRAKINANASSSTARDLDPTDNAREAAFDVLDEPLRVLLVAGGPSRDYRFLRDSLFRDAAFEADVWLQSAAGAVTQDARRVLAGPPATLAEFAGYDAVVAIDPDWRPSAPAAFGDEAVEALTEWVASRGGGLIVVGGSVGLPRSVRVGLPRALRAALPLRLEDDPLASEAAAAGRRDGVAVRPTDAGRAIAWIESALAAGSGDDLSADAAQNASLLTYGVATPAEPKAGASVLATRGERPADEPWLVEHRYGAGRVAFIATPETWRLRTVDPNAFVALHAGLLRRVASGRLRGGDAEATLRFDKPEYAVGELMAVRYVARPGSAGEVALPTVARWRLGEGPIRDASLEPLADQPGVAVGRLRADRAGEVEATVATPGGETLVARAEMLLPDRERQAEVQDAALLRTLAERTGGQYFDLTAQADRPTASEAFTREIEALAAAIAPRTETRLVVGPVDTEASRRLSGWWLGSAAVALLLEWVTRRLTRLA